MTKAHGQDRTSSEAIAKFWNRYIHAVEESDTRIPRMQGFPPMISESKVILVNDIISDLH